MTPTKARAHILRLLDARKREIVWLVKHRVSGTTECAWFRREEPAKRFANLIMDATIEMVHYKLGAYKEFGFADDRIRDVVHS